MTWLDPDGNHFQGLVKLPWITGHIQQCTPHRGGQGTQLKMRPKQLQKMKNSPRCWEGEAEILQFLCSLDGAHRLLTGWTRILFFLYCLINLSITCQCSKKFLTKGRFSNWREYFIVRKKISGISPVPHATAPGIILYSVYSCSVVLYVLI